MTSNRGPTADIMMKLKMMMVVYIFMSTLLQLTKTTTRTHQNPVSWGRKETVHQENNGPLYTRVIVLVTTVRDAMESKNVSISGCERVDFEGVVILPDQLGLKQPLMSRSIVQTAISFPPPKFECLLIFDMLSVNIKSRYFCMYLIFFFYHYSLINVTAFIASLF